MSTRSAIGMRLPNGKVKGIYCHSDGYLSYNGVLLETEYKDKAKVEKLLNQGDMSILKKKIEPNPNLPHNFDYSNRQEDVCVFYGRDRGEEGCEAQIFDSEEDFSNGFDAQYVYLLEVNEKWKVNELDGEGFKDLHSKLVEEGLI